MVVAARLALLGPEILHGLVVEQRIDGLDVRIGIALVHVPANADAPLGRVVRVHHVAGHGGENGEHIAPVELIQQYHRNQDELDDGGHELHDHHAHDYLDGISTA